MPLTGTHGLMLARFKQRHLLLNISLYRFPIADIWQVYLPIFRQTFCTKWLLPRDNLQRDISSPWQLPPTTIYHNDSLYPPTIHHHDRYIITTIICHHDNLKTFNPDVFPPWQFVTLKSRQFLKNDAIQRDYVHEPEAPIHFEIISLFFENSRRAVKKVRNEFF